MAKKRVTLPKDFSQLIEANDIDALKAVFTKCELNAVGGYGKQTALSAFNIPDELVRWLVAQGADINIRDTYGCTPLHNHASRRSGKVDVFFELGADIEAVDSSGNTALHFAASNNNLAAVELLLTHGAKATVKNKRGLNPLEKAVAEANNIDIINLLPIAKLLLNAGCTVTKTVQDSMTRLGEGFEFHRSNFAEEYLEATSNALDELYQLFNVTPVPRRAMHDGKSPIVPKAKGWEKQYAELWDLLIPSQGPAQTVQGEVIRITGRVRDELYRNGGANWDADFRKMLNALLKQLESANALDKKQLEEAAQLCKQVNGTFYDAAVLNRLCELSLQWVLLNPKPIMLGEVAYER